MSLRHFIIACSPLISTLAGGAQEPTPGEAAQPHVISFFFTPTEKPSTIYSIHDFAQMIGTPGSANLALIRQRHTTATVSGIPVLHAGRVTFSDNDGHVILPRGQLDEDITLIVSDRVSPVISHGNTVSHWRLREQNKAARYTMTRKTVDNKTIWSVKPEPTNIIDIPATALIILAPPSSIIMPKEPVSTSAGQNLLLPNIRVIASPELQNAALNVININKFFVPPHDWNAYAAERYLVSTT